MGGMEYILAMVSIVGITIAFVSVTNGALRQGVETVTSDLSRPDSLSQNIGAPEIEAPVSSFELEPGALPHAYAGQAYNFDFISLLSASEGTLSTQLTWSLTSGTLPAGLSFSDGVLSGTHNLIGPAQIVPLTVEVSLSGATTSQNYDLVLRDEGISLLPGTPDTILAGVPYGFRLVNFADFPDGVTNADVSWSVVSGAFQPGILMSSDTGVVAGTYTGFEDYQTVVEVMATAQGISSTQFYTFDALGSGIVLSATDTFEWEAGQPVSFDFSTLVSTSSSVSPHDLTWSVQFLKNDVYVFVPEGISVDGPVVAGTPVGLSDDNVVMRVQASYENYSAVRDYPIAFTGSGIALSSINPAIVRANILYDFSLKDRLSVGEGVDENLVTWSLVSGQLPSGLALNETTGKISGTYSGLYDLSPSITVRAALPGGAFAEREYTMTVIGAGVVANPSVLPTVPYDEYYTFDFKTTLTTREDFDASTLTWSLSGGPLPSGITLDTQTGVLSGTQSEGQDKMLSLLVVASDSQDIYASAFHTLKINGLEPFELYAGGTSTCLLDQNGKPWCVGSAANGKLGSGLTTGNALSFVAVDTQTSGEGFVQLDVGTETVCGLQDDGDVWCWGEGSLGQLGNGDGLDSATPVKVLRSAMGNVVRVEVGVNHACALDDMAQVWCWGSQNVGMLGNGVTGGQVNAPVKVNTTLMTRDIIGLDVGLDFACAWDTANQAWCWGVGTAGQLGAGSLSSSSTPVAVNTGTGMSTVKSISAGLFHTCALDVAGKAWCWGEGSGGRIGDSATAKRTSPQAVVATDIGVGLTDLKAGNTHSCALLSNGEVWCWGQGSRLGLGTTAGSVVPVKVVDSTMGAVVGLGIGAGANHSCAWNENLEAWCWGFGGNGRLGTGTTSNQLAPAAVLMPSSL